MKISWPSEYKFAFTIFDDTDWATVKNVKPVYDFLTDLGLKTTKSVWMLKGQGIPTNEGSTCENKEYLEWIFSLQQKGFEIGLHNAAPFTSTREITLLALDRFRTLFGAQKVTLSNHVGCLESLYWGEARLTGWRRTIYNILTKGHKKNLYRGHIEGDPLFWGDLSQERVNYVRNFTFNELNTLNVFPGMPYHDPSRPYVNFWFLSTNGSSCAQFLKNLHPRKIDLLEEQGGLCIMYVHFAAGFARQEKVPPELRQCLEYIASKKGWFRPVSEILDYLRKGKNTTEQTISPRELRRLETRWLTAKFFRGTA